jgi:hypothetical protein
MHAGDTALRQTPSDPVRTQAEIRRWAGLLILALLAGACGFAGSPTTVGPSSVTVTAAAAAITAAPSPSPRLVQELLLIGEVDGSMASALQAWAEQRGWVVRQSDELAREPGPATAAAVLAGPEGQAALAAFSAAGILTVALDLETASPGPQLSTVGRPGAREDQAGFLAGAVAALITRSGQVGLISDPAGVYPQAFLHGLRYLCVRCGLVELAPEQASTDAFRAKTVDVVAVLPGAEAAVAAQALSGQGFWLVLVGQPAGSGTPGEVAARVVFESDSMLIAALEALLEGAPGQAWPYSAALGSLRLAEVDPGALSAGRRQALDQALQALADGSLDPGVSPPASAP